jgi:hypothetical protein
VAKSSEGRGGPDLSPDEIVEAVLGRGAPQNLITLVGFLGDSDTSGHHRLFVDPALTCWLDVPDADIVHRHHIPEEQETYGGRSMLYVKRGAVLLKGEVTTADAEAAFLSGGDTRALCSEPDERLLVCQPLATAHTKTYLPSPRTSECC